MSSQISVTFLNSMGCDKTVVNAARVSFNKQQQASDVMGTSEVMLKKDIKLIKYLAKHKHLSPFGHCFASFHVKAPIFVARQLVKHQYLRLNEISRRYVSDKPEFYSPKVWRGKPIDKKQGSDGVVSTQVDTHFVTHTALTAYNDLLEDGVAPEQARLVLPLSLMTEFWWSGSLDALAAMAKLRLAPDTQAETKIVAKGIDSCLKVLYPYAWNALLDREVT